jgi:hypothetical protein
MRTPKGDIMAARITSSGTDKVTDHHLTISIAGAPEDAHDFMDLISALKPATVIGNATLADDRRNPGNLGIRYTVFIWHDMAAFRAAIEFLHEYHEGTK